MFTTEDVYIFMFPGIMYFWVFFIGQGPMQEVLDERDGHTLARMLASPVTRLEFLLSKVIRCFLLCAVIELVLLVASAVLFGVEWGDPWLLGPVVLVCAFSVTGVLAFTYALARTKAQAFALCNIVVIVFALLGGSFFPFYDFPPLLQAIGQFSPNRWGIVAIQSVAYSRPWVELVKPVVILCAIGLVGSVAALVVMHRRLAEGGGR